MSKHTQGPWRYGEAGDMGVVYGPDNYIVCARLLPKDARHIVKCVNMHDKLLGALQDAQAYLDGHQGKMFTKEALLELIENAIAKAKEA